MTRLRESVMLSTLAGAGLLAFLNAISVGMFLGVLIYVFTLRDSPKIHVAEIAGVSVVVSMLGAPLTLVSRTALGKFFSKYFGNICTFVSALALVLGLIHFNNTVPNRDFFDISAQVLPVLLLAAVVDVRISASIKNDQLLWPLVIVVIGEAVCLDMAATSRLPQHSGSLLALVVASIASATCSLLLALTANWSELKTES